MNRTEAMLMHAKIVAAGGALYGEKVAVFRDDAEKMSDSGLLHIPDQSQRKPLRGRCIMVGLGIQAEQDKMGDKSEWAGLRVGDFLTFSKYDGTVIEVPLMDESLELEVMHGYDVYLGFGREES